jgi:hypothetical protein
LREQADRRLHQYFEPLMRETATVVDAIGARFVPREASGLVDHEVGSFVEGYTPREPLAPAFENLCGSLFKKIGGLVSSVAGKALSGLQHLALGPFLNWLKPRLLSFLKAIAARVVGRLPAPVLSAARLLARRHGLPLANPAPTSPAGESSDERADEVDAAPQAGSRAPPWDHSMSSRRWGCSRALWCTRCAAFTRTPAKRGRSVKLIPSRHGTCGTLLCGQRQRVLANALAQRQRKLQVSDSDTARVRKARYPIGAACARRRAADDDAVIAPLHAIGLSAYRVDRISVAATISMRFVKTRGYSPVWFRLVRLGLRASYWDVTLLGGCPKSAPTENRDEKQGTDATSMKRRLRHDGDAQSRDMDLSGFLVEGSSGRRQLVSLTSVTRERLVVARKHGH